MVIRDITQKILKNINTLLNEEDVKLFQVKTTEGLILEYENLEIGVEVFVVDADGLTPIEDGTYIFEDGTSIDVLDGKIATILEPVSPVEEPDEEPTEMIENSGTTTPEMNMNDEILKRIEALEKSNEEFKTNLEKLSTIENDNNEIKVSIEELAESLNKLLFNKDVKASMVERKNIDKDKIDEQINLQKSKYDRPIKSNNTKLSNILENIEKYK